MGLPSLPWPLSYGLATPGVYQILRGRRGSLFIKEFPLWRADKRQSSGVSLLNQRNPLISGRGAEAHCQSVGPESGREKKPSPHDPSWKLELGRQVPGATLETKSGQARSTSLNNGFRWAPACPAHTSDLGRVCGGPALRDTSLTGSCHLLTGQWRPSLQPSVPSTLVIAPEGRTLSLLCPPDALLFGPILSEEGCVGRGRRRRIIPQPPPGARAQLSLLAKASA